MGTKKNPGEFDCYANALDDEPMFVLLGRDSYAPSLVRFWAHERKEQILAGKRPPEDWLVVYEAMSLAQDMIHWRFDKDGKWKKRPSESKKRIHRWISSATAL